MIKKMRNLTDEEMEKICNENHKKYHTCYDCPLQLDGGYCFKDLELNKEFEVEDE